MDVFNKKAISELSDKLASMQASHREEMSNVERKSGDAIIRALGMGNSKRARANISMETMTPRTAWAYYMSNQPLRHAVEQIYAVQFASIPFQVYDKVKREFVPEDESTPLDDLRDMLNDSPNEGISGTEYRKMDSISFNVTGGSFMHITAVDENSEPTELNYIPPQWVVLNSTGDHRVASITVTDGPFRGAYERSTSPSGRAIYVDKLGHELDYSLKNFNPSPDQLFGLPIISSALNELEQYEVATKQNTSFLKKGARLSGMVTLDGDMADPTPEEQLLLQARFRDFYQGEDSAGEVLIMKGGKDFKELSTNNKDMDYIKMMESVTRKVYLTLNIPMPLVDTGTMTNSNYSESKTFLYDMSIIPFAEFYIAQKCRTLLRRYKKNKDRYTLKVNANNIPAIRDRNDKAAIESGSLTFNEVRKLHKFEAIGEEGDKLYIPSNLVEIGTSAMPFGNESTSLNEVPSKDKVKPEDVEKEVSDNFSTSKETAEKIFREMKNEDGGPKYNEEGIKKLLAGFFN